MNAFFLKIVAIVTMIIDHSGYLIKGGVSYFNYIGRLAFPIFAFQISQGYIHTKNLKKYITRLALFAVISQIPFTLFLFMVTGREFTWHFTTFFSHLNIFFTLLLGLLAILAYEKLKVVGLLIAIGLGWFASFINADYGFFGVAIITLFYIFRDKKVLMAISFILTVIAHYGIRTYNQFREVFPDNTLEQLNLHFQAGNLNRTLILCLCTILPIIFILAYNGKKGRDLKQVLYWFYPVHLLILYILWLI